VFHVVTPSPDHPSLWHCPGTRWRAEGPHDTGTLDEQRSNTRGKARDNPPQLVIAFAPA